MSGIKTYFLTIIAIGIGSSVLITMLPAGNGKKLTSAGVGLVLLLVSLNVISQIEWEDIEKSFTELAAAEHMGITEIPVDHSNIISGIIKEDAETYILDKAKEIGADIVKAEVIMQTDADKPRPLSVKITGMYSQGQQQKLSAVLEEDLAIRPEAQQWIWTTNK